MAKHESDARRFLGSTEEELRRSNEDWKNIFHAIGDYVLILAPDHTILQANRTVMEKSGLALEELVGQKCYGLFHGVDRPPADCPLTEMITSCHQVIAPMEVQTLAGTFLVSCTPVFDEAGEIIKVIHIATDITASKREEALLAEQVRLLSLSSAIGVVLTKAGTVRDMLTGCCELLVQNLGAAFARVWTVNERGDLLILQASAGLYTHIDGPHGRIPVDEKTKIGTIGSSRMPHTTNQVIGDPKVSNQDWAKKEGMVAFAGHPLLIEGQMIGVVGLFFRQPLSEITSRAIASIADEVALGIERLRSEERLRRSNRALGILSRCNETLIHTFSEQELLDKVCALIVGPEGYLMAWVGYAEADEGRTIRPMAHAGLEEGYLEAIQVSWADSETGRGPMGTAVRDGKISIVKDIQADPEFSLWRPVATQRGYASIIALPLTDSSARTFGALCIYSSESNAFNANEVKLLSEMAGDLSFGINNLRMQEERKKEQLASQKLQERLRQAQKLESIGTLAGGIAHDFNNILSAILGFTKLAKEEIDPHSQAGEDLQQVIKAAERAVSLVRQILTISRKGERKKHPIKVQDIIGEALKLLRPSISTSIEINKAIEVACPEILADPTEIHQVIMNLCTNALHAIREMDSGGHAIDIRLLSIELDEAAIRRLSLTLSPGRFVKLSVADTGCGMDEETKAKIFDLYFTTKEKGQGTGLGMATAYSIVTDSGGDIFVESKMGEGTTMSVYFPLYEGSGPEKGQADNPLSPERGSEQILVVDDEEPIAQLLQRTLTKYGYQVTALTSSEDALRIFREQPATFDLVITDMNMPKVMGTALAQDLLETRPELPIILCTGLYEEDVIEQAKKIGIREFLAKPVDRDVLLSLVRKSLDKNKRHISDKGV